MFNIPQFYLDSQLYVLVKKRHKGYNDTHGGRHQFNAMLMYVEFKLIQFNLCHGTEGK